MFDPVPNFTTDEETDVGLVRNLNEDSLLSRPNIGVWIVADGMGGHSGGDFASQTIVLKNRENRRSITRRRTDARRT